MSQSEYLCNLCGIEEDYDNELFGILFDDGIVGFCGKERSDAHICSSCLKNLKRLKIEEEIK